jgi:anaerobic selenocysteine-containing dehydrogenase
MGSEVRVAKSACRSCITYCPVEVTIQGREVLGVEPNYEAPLYEGFICPKGRALKQAHNEPSRLLHHLKRLPDGHFEPISSERLVEEISTRLQRILQERGPRAIATFLGGPSTEQPASGALMFSFLQAIGSDSFYYVNTIDQPGDFIANALHGTWAGGHPRPEKLEVFLLIGSNPVISKQYFSQNPGRQIKRMVRGGARLIVIDPRRTETARHAHLHLQCIPGEDPTILAGLIHLILAAGQVDQPFVAANAAGLAALSEAVADFTPSYVAARAGIPEQQLREAARLLGEAGCGEIGSGVGPSMATRGVLSSYLIRCLRTLRGFWGQEGDEAVRPPVLLPPREYKAQPNPPYPAWGFGRTMRVRGLQQSVAGLPVAALCEEILTPGEDQIRAMVLHAGAILTWPQTELVKRALRSLELLVVHDVEWPLSPTAALADYVIATRKTFEMPLISQQNELVGITHHGYGWVEPYAAYHPALFDAPEGSDLLEAWQIYYRVAQRLGIQLKCCGFFSDPQTAPLIDMQHEPTTDDLYELMCSGSAVPLSEVKRHPNGKVFDEARAIIGPRDPGCTARLDLGNGVMLGQLRAVRAESISQRRGTNAEYPYLYIPSRIQNATNAGYRPTGVLKRGYNPAYLHSSDLAQLGLRPGDQVEIRSRHGRIVAFVAADDDLRPGVMAMAHGFGKGPGQDYDPRRDGANVNNLLHWEDDYDPYTGMPRMGALPVAIAAVAG